MRRAAPVIFTYLTNLSPEEFDPDQLVALYSRRWGIEDFFEQTHNQYAIGRFPARELGLVKVHIALTLSGYLLLRQFQQVAAEWVRQADYAVLSLPKDGTATFRSGLLARAAGLVALAPGAVR